MGWTNALNQIFERYSGAGGGAASAPADVHQDFIHVAQTAPREEMAQGIAQAMRSDQTPPFAEMVGKLFRQSDPNQRAGLLNRLLAAAGAGAIPGVGAPGTVTPEQASQVAPEQVQQAAARAEQQKPSIVDEVSSFYAEHPAVVKALGGLALSIAIQHMARRR